MTTRPETVSNGAYGSPVAAPHHNHGERGYGESYASQSHPNQQQQQSQHYNNDHATGVSDFAAGNPEMSSPLQNAPSSTLDREARHADAPEVEGLNRSASTASTMYNRDTTPSRSGTLKKRQASVSRKGSLRRSGSKKSLTAGSIKGVGYAGDDAEGDEYNSALYTPIPTHGSPTEVLANRFQAWRTLLKTLITYFREVQSSYDHRSKALGKVSNVMQNLQHPSVFITDGGLADATRVLSDYHKHSLTEANKSRDIEADVIQALNGLRSDLAQKIKEIKSLSGDFKNTVDKEKEGTKKAVSAYTEALHHASTDDSGKNDPFLVRLSVDRAIERQIDEENYLHRAYLNLETSGRELESIVVGEIQKAYNALAGILKREGDDAYNAVEQLRTGPIAMPKDFEWTRFVEHDPTFVNPSLPIRKVEDILYPGKHSPSAAELRAGMLERKSKYLKSYTPGWYVLSPTHLHEFKSADKIYSQPPVMSLYLLDQKLGSHSSPDSSSHKFMLKGRQSGGMHRGHSWVFRAESYDTMLAWYEAIKVLTEKTGEERNAFVREHARSVSGNQHRPASISSDGLEEDEADQVPYSASSSLVNAPVAGETKPTRPLPGGRFPSDLNVNRDRALSPSEESEPERDTIAAAGAIPGSGPPFPGSQRQSNQQYDADPYRLQGIATHTDVPVAAAALHQAERGHAQDHSRSGEDKIPVSAARAPIREFETNPVDRFNHQPVQDTAYPRFDQQQQHQRQQQPSPQQHQPQQYRQPPPVQTQTFAMPMHDQQNLHQVQSQPEVSPLEQQRHHPIQSQREVSPLEPLPQQQPQRPVPVEGHQLPSPVRQNTDYSQWLAPAAAGVGAGALGAAAYNQHNKARDEDRPLTHEPEEATLDHPGQTERRISDSIPAGFVPIPINNGNNTIETSRALDPAPLYPERASSLSHERATSIEPAVAHTPAQPAAQPIAYPTAQPTTQPTAQPIAQSTAWPASNEPLYAGAFTDRDSIGRSSLSPEEVKRLAATAAETQHYRDPALGATEKLGGLESKGAHGTGQLFPAVIRHESGMSISQLHVPGEFPAGTEGVTGRSELGSGVRTTTQGSFVPPSQWHPVRD